MSMTLGTSSQRSFPTLLQANEICHEAFTERKRLSAVVLHDRATVA
jgi:hypothetical protein